MEMNPNHILIKLTGEEVQRAKDVASVRRCGKVGFTSTHVYGNDTTAYLNDVMGVKGEMAFGKFCGIDIDDTQRLAGDRGVDFVVEDVRVDVQTSKHYPRLNLLYDSSHPFRADYAVLASNPYPESVYLCGYISRDEFIRLAVDKDCGFGMRRAVYVDQLHPMQEIIL
jgi:hypothetical protein